MASGDEKSICEVVLETCGWPEREREREKTWVGLGLCRIRERSVNVAFRFNVRGSNTSDRGIRARSLNS